MTDLDYSLEFYKDASSDWRWRLKHSNGQIVAASSEGFFFTGRGASQRQAYA